MLPCLDAAGVRTIAEVGAFAGDLTRVLVDWAAGAGARVAAIDPAPQPALLALEREHPELELIRDTSLAALPRIALPDAIVLDGDHNYWTVGEELRLIDERAPGADMPLLLFHDACWPHGRRDDYFAPEQIPAEHRHPVAGDGGGLMPGEPGRAPVSALGRPRGRAAQRGPDGGRGLRRRAAGPAARRRAGVLRLRRRLARRRAVGGRGRAHPRSARPPSRAGAARGEPGLPPRPVSRAALRAVRGAAAPRAPGDAPAPAARV